MRTKMKQIRLINAYNSPLSNGGIFADLTAMAAELQISLPFPATAAGVLDADYFGNNSGLKITSPLIDMYIEENEADEDNEHPERLTTTQRETLAKIIINKFFDNWDHIADAYFETEYEPLQNYDSNEEHSEFDTVLETPTDWKETITETPTDWKEERKREKADNEDESNTGIFAMNSDDPVPTTSSTSSNKFKEDLTRSGTYKTEKEQAGTKEVKTTYGHKIHKFGNIGVTTSQQMLQSELDLRTYDYFAHIYKDIDEVLTINTY